MAAHSHSFYPTCLLLDLDDTLYQVEEIPDIVRRNIQGYMRTKLDIPEDQIASLCLEYYTKYGTTMAGLVANGYTIDFDDWHAEVHGTLPYSRLLKRDDRMREFLQSIPLPKYIFTNADQKHADTCLELMGVADLFQGIICFESLMETGRKLGVVKDNKPVICKPTQQAMELALKAAGAEAATTVFCDDSTRNVSGGHAVGMFSVLVGRTSKDCDCDLQVPSLFALREAMPGLWAVPPSTEHLEAVRGADADEEDALYVPPVARGQGVSGGPAESAADCRRREVKVAAA
ncbi:probable suppressor of disruption of TFIIS [Coccomyxa sp. Obi]|nr:probable suppressor of disruption of TFIIS [Coccomyxa sp. Obi]